LGFLTNYVWLSADSIEVTHGVSRKNNIKVEAMSVVWAGILLLIVPLHILPGVAAFLSHSPYFRHLQQVFGIPCNAQDFVYLSDGGHLENLGAYSLMKEQQLALEKDMKAVGEEEYKSVMRYLEVILIV
jgi:hypothetical protein